MNEYRDSSEKLTIDFHSIDSEQYSEITKTITSELSLEAVGSKTNGLDEVFQDFKRGNEVVGLEWDNWSGYIVTAKTKLSEPLVREIASYINAKFNS